MIFKCSWVYFLVFKARLLGLVLALTFTLLSGPLVSVYADNDDDDVFVDDDDDDDGGNPMDQQLRELLVQQGVTALDPGPAQNPAQVDLGQALFFDWELSGNRDIGRRSVTAHWHGRRRRGCAGPIASNRRRS
jgi:hypothetical protein